jgi:hypothetical protein
MTEPSAIRRPLTRELEDAGSPVRQFLDARFTSGLGDVQRRYRESAPPLAVPGVPRAEADPGTVGTAADWLLRFLICPQPELHLVVGGAAACRKAGIDVAPALAGIAGALGVPLPARPPERVRVFTGPVPGSDADPGLLARSCWALALLTEAFRAGPVIAARGPLGRFRGGSVSGDDLLGLAPPAGLTQLAEFRHVFETALLPQLAARIGPWALGPTFAGSELIKADADLIAAGLLLELKTSAKLSLGIADLLQVIGYALLDFDDDYRVAELGIFTARYGYLATWELGALLRELAGHEISVQSARDEFRGFLLACADAG